MSNKVELIIGGLSVIGIAFALYLVQERINIGTQTVATEIAKTPQPGIIVVDSTARSNEAALRAAFDTKIDKDNNFSRMVIDDIKIGTGLETKVGDTVLVHYVGTLQTGLQFDNSRERGAPFEFTVGAGQVIEGWDEGLVGMREGGERILVVPPEKAYGDTGIGPIPGGATLVFNIQLLEVK